MSAAFRILRSAEHVTMPWKNGGGVTTEIAVHPPGASLDTFLWRVSMAVVARDGPFSSFEGIDRTLVLLQGRGMRLDVEGRAPVTLVEGSAPLAFPADVPTSAYLLDGPIRDLNVMTRRGRFRHEVDVIEAVGIAKGAISAPVALVLCQTDGASVQIGGQALDLKRDDVLVIEGLEATALILVPQSVAKYAVINIWPVA